MLRLPLNNPRRSPFVAYFDISHAGETYRINLRRLASARRFTLRVRTAKCDIVLTMPVRGSLKEAKCFAARHVGWIGAKLRRLPERILFAEGETIPLRGVPHRITHCATRHSAVWIETGSSLWANIPLLCVGGDAPFLARRVRDYLLNQAKSDIESAVFRHTAKLGISARKISLRDPVSRWGSCSASGALSFSWRLILAPDFVLNYLAVHEVAHLVHMNHSKAFWAAVAQLTSDTVRAEAWLKEHGSGLLRFGPSP